MTIVRAERPDKRFTILRNEVLQDERLSYRARGILASILSRPDNWRCSAWDLARDGSEGRRAILTALTELENCGYLKRTKWQDQSGQWQTDSIIYDKPVDNSVDKSVENPVDKGPTGVRLPDAGSPNLGKRTLLKEPVKELDKPPKPPYQPLRRIRCNIHFQEVPCRGCAADDKAKKD